MKDWLVWVPAGTHFLCLWCRGLGLPSRAMRLDRQTHSTVTPLYEPTRQSPPFIDLLRNVYVDFCHFIW